MNVINFKQNLSIKNLKWAQIVEVCAAVYPIHTYDLTI